MIKFLDGIIDSIEKIAAIYIVFAGIVVFINFLYNIIIRSM